MKVAILAGGRGTRLAEETRLRPKALVEIGGRPILRHIMQYYADSGWKQFVLALGYAGDQIRTYFANSQPDDWSVDLVETGLATDTGGRVLRLRPWLHQETFMLTWCDGLSNVDLHALLRFHRSHDRLVTVTAVHPPPKFGRMLLEGDQVCRFAEKQTVPDEWINGAFFVVDPGVFEYIDGDSSSWERDVMRRLVQDGQLMAYRHESFWQCMDTIHERDVLERCWQSGTAPWQTKTDRPA